jgi:hypothetical protein
MTRPFKFFVARPILFALSSGSMLLMGTSLLLAAPRPDQPAYDVVGVIEGEAIVVSGSMNVDVVNGQARTTLRSGSDVRVKSGQARIDLVEGGNIVICGPAHFSVLKSASALTVALDSGTIHVHIKREPSLTVYTAQIQALPVAIGDGPEDLLVGFDVDGTLCVLAVSGAVRLEQQFTGQSAMVPQSGDVLIANGQLDALRTAPGHCSCELQVEEASPPPAPPPAPLATTPEVGVLASNEDIRKNQVEATPQPQPPAKQRVAAKQGPIYQVFMPPLAYDSSAKVQPDFDPRFIILVRRVRVRSTLTFKGRVQGDPVLVASNAAPPNSGAADPHSNQQTTPKPATTSKKDSILDRVRAFFRRLWTRSS